MPPPLSSLLLAALLSRAVTATAAATSFATPDVDIARRVDDVARCRVMEARWQVDVVAGNGTLVRASMVLRLDKYNGADAVCEEHRVAPRDCAALRRKTERVIQTVEAAHMAFLEGIVNEVARAGLPGPHGDAAVPAVAMERTWPFLFTRGLDAKDAKTRVIWIPLSLERSFMPSVSDMCHREELNSGECGWLEASVRRYEGFARSWRFQYQLETQNITSPHVNFVDDDVDDVQATAEGGSAAGFLGAAGEVGGAESLARRLLSTNPATRYAHTCRQRANELPPWPVIQGLPALVPCPPSPTVYRNGVLWLRSDEDGKDGGGRDIRIKATEAAEVDMVTAKVAAAVISGGTLTILATNYTPHTHDVLERQHEGRIVIEKPLSAMSSDRSDPGGVAATKPQSNVWVGSDGVRARIHHTSTPENDNSKPGSGNQPINGRDSSRHFGGTSTPDVVAEGLHFDVIRREHIVEARRRLRKRLEWARVIEMRQRARDHLWTRLVSNGVPGVPGVPGLPGVPGSMLSSEPTGSAPATSAPTPLTPPPAVNIYLLTLESVARSQFMAYCPKTREYLRRLMVRTAGNGTAEKPEPGRGPENNLRAFVFGGFHSAESGSTAQVMTPAMSGHRYAYDQAQWLTCNDAIKSIPAQDWLPNIARRHGYVTALATSADAGRSPIHGCFDRITSLADDPRVDLREGYDHHMPIGNKHRDTTGGIPVCSQYPTEWKTDMLCAGGQRCHEHAQGYGERFFNTYSDLPRFMWAHFLEPHDSAAYTSILDESLPGHIDRIMASDTQNRTVVVLMGDHGPPSSEHQHLPLFSIIAPDSLVCSHRYRSSSSRSSGSSSGNTGGGGDRQHGLESIDHPDCIIDVHSLRANQERLVSHFDVYETLRFLIEGWPARNRHESTRERESGSGHHHRTFAPNPTDFGGHVPRNFLHETMDIERTCDDAGIPSLHCSCTAWNDIDVAEEEVGGQVAAMLVSELLHNISTTIMAGADGACALPLALDEVISLRYFSKSPRVFVPLNDTSRKGAKRSGHRGDNGDGGKREEHVMSVDNESHFEVVFTTSHGGASLRYRALGVSAPLDMDSVYQYIAAATAAGPATLSQSATTASSSVLPQQAMSLLLQKTDRVTQITRYHPFEHCTPAGYPAEFCVCGTAAVDLMPEPPVISVPAASAVGLATTSTSPAAVAGTPTPPLPADTISVFIDGHSHDVTFPRQTDAAVAALDFCTQIMDRTAQCVASFKTEIEAKRSTGQSAPRLNERGYKDVLQRTFPVTSFTPSSSSDNAFSDMYNTQDSRGGVETNNVEFQSAGGQDTTSASSSAERATHVQSLGRSAEVELSGPHQALYFIQVGAHIGNTPNDPVYGMVNRDPRWRGLLVEPVPELHTALRQNYEALLEAGRVETANFAVCNRTGPAPMYRVDDIIVERERRGEEGQAGWVEGEATGTYEAVRVGECGEAGEADDSLEEEEAWMKEEGTDEVKEDGRKQREVASSKTRANETNKRNRRSDQCDASARKVYYPGAKGDGITPSQATSLDRRLLETHLPGQVIHTVDVQCITAALLLRHHQARLFPSRADRPGSLFDLLVVDAEGYDANVVDAVLDAVSINGAGKQWISTMLPRVIRFEEKHLTTPRREALLERLRELGYTCIDIQGGDELCHLTNSTAESERIDN